MEQKLKEAQAGQAKSPVADALGRCRFCMQTDCPSLSGGKPCREFWQAVNYSSEKRAERRKKREADAEKKNKDDE